MPTLEQATRNLLVAIEEIKQLTNAVSINDSTLTDGGYGIHLKEDEFAELSQDMNVITTVFDASGFYVEKSFHIEGVKFFCLIHVGEEEWHRLKGYVKGAV